MHEGKLYAGEGPSDWKSSYCTSYRKAGDLFVGERNELVDILCELVGELFVLGDAPFAWLGWAEVVELVGELEEADAFEQVDESVGKIGEFHGIADERLAIQEMIAVNLRPSLLLRFAWDLLVLLLPLPEPSLVLSLSSSYSAD